MPSTPKRTVAYNFDPLFEKQVVLLACSRPRFFGRVGIALDPELLKNETSRLAVRAAHAINRDLGHGPGAAIGVIQRLRRWMDDGRVTLEEVKAVAELFDEAEDAGVMSEDEVAAEVAPMLQRRMRDQAVEAAVNSYANPGDDLSKVLELADRANRIGQVDTSVGMIIGPESFAEISKLKDLQRLPTGIDELDSGLDGGLQNGGLGVVVAESGGGKSIFLSQVSGRAFIGGGFVAYATLEVPPPIVAARIKAGITGVPINALLAGDHDLARARLNSYADRSGVLVVQDFTPYATTIEDLKEWVGRCEELAKRPLDLLVVDYGDKVGAKAKKGDKESSEYTSGRVVFEGLRIFAAERKMFCWTASQSTRKKDRRKLLDLDDVADSMHKIRVADLVVTLNLESEGEDLDPMMKIRVAKHRTGRSRFDVGPFPTEFETGRVCPFLDDGGAP